MLVSVLAEFAKVGEVGISKLVWFERERKVKWMFGECLYLFIYFIPVWVFCFVLFGGFVCVCGRDQERWIGNGFNKSNKMVFQPLWTTNHTVRMLPRQYLFQSWWNFRSHQMQLSIPASLCTESMVLHNIFQDFRPLHCAFAAGNGTACSLRATENRKREKSPF